MGPKRKKSKPNPAEEEGTTQRSPEVEGATQQATTTTQSASNGKERSSWYGSWNSAKSLPTPAQIARESISVSQGAVTSSTSESPSARPNSVSKIARGGSRKSIPQAAEVTRVHATSDAADQSRPRFSSGGEKVKAAVPEQAIEVVVEDAQLPPQPDGMVGGDVGGQGKGQAGPWYAWWSRPDGYGSDADMRKSKRVKLEEVEDATSTPLPGTPLEQPVEIGKNARDFEGIGEATGDGKGGTQQSGIPARGWFGMWSSAQNEPSPAATDAPKPATQDATPAIVVSEETPPVPIPAVETVKTQDTGTGTQTPPGKSSGWAFWSSDKLKDPLPTPGGTQKQIGEIAVADTPSQSHPEAAQFNAQPDDVTTAAKPISKRGGSLLRPTKGLKSRPTTASDSSSPLPLSPATTPSASEQPSRAATPPQIEASSILTRIPDPPKPVPKPQNSPERTNLILPSFKSTFPFAPNPGYIERLTAYLAQSLHLPGTQPSPASIHIYRSSSPPRIKKAVALGIHGFFPAAMIQKLIGQPRGTSVRFANYAAIAIKTWCEDRQPDVKNVEIEKVALEGEGYIADRVTTLWKLLLNWLSHLRQADFIFVACHSQGVPVAVMLVAKLIQLNCLKPTVRLGICAMAGINLGPFLEYRSRFFGGTALELFDFSDPKSTVSRAYAESLTLCLRHGVRVTFAGSIDDQLVSIESSLHTPLRHPYIFRAIFIDGRLHAPNFLTHLVVFAAKLRNLGVSDHGLIRELSAPLAGSIVGGEGHSRIYDEPAVYRVAIDFTLESTDVPASPSPTPPSQPAERLRTRRTSLAESGLPTAPALASHLRRSSLAYAGGPTPSITTPGSNNTVSPIMQPYEPPAPAGTANPFYLPWAVRGMLEEELVKSDPSLRDEVLELVKEFEDWRPATRGLRDVRWRLEGVRGMV